MAPGPAVDSPPARSLRGLVFEMTNVLYDATLWRCNVVRLLVRLGVPATYPTFFELWDHEYLAAVQCGFRQFEEAFQAFLLAKGLAWSQVDEIEAASRVRRKELEACSRPLPGVAATIAALARLGLPQAVLTDSPYPAGRDRGRTGQIIAGQAAFRPCSRRSTWRPPSPPPSATWPRSPRLDLAADEVALVASDQASLAGARACGLRTIAVNWPDDVVADARLTKFNDLLTLCERWTALQVAA